jgi:hypothetical protein
MEASASGDGCRPSIGAMMWSEARAIAAVANMTGDGALADTFATRATRLRDWYLEHLWSDDAAWFTVLKEGVEFSGQGGCTEEVLKQGGASRCCCVREMPDPPGQFENFTLCSDVPPPSTSPLASPRKRCPRLNSWECDKTVTVRELLGLGPPYFFGIPPAAAAPTKFDSMWQALFDARDGFWGEWGPTTLERRSPCFNLTKNKEACSWAGPSWPFETSRVLTGLSNFLVDYPQAAAAGMTSAHYTRLLRSYARSMTQSFAANGSTPWIGENIDADSGRWIDRTVLQSGGCINTDGVSPRRANCESLRSLDARAHLFRPPPCFPLPSWPGSPCGVITNCHACEGTCWDRKWAKYGGKCDRDGLTAESPLGSCDKGCPCVPPDQSFDLATFGPPQCCDFGEPMRSCHGKRMPTPDHDRGVHYNHATFIDNVIEGFVGVRPAFGDTLVVQPSADAQTVTHFALDNLYYHGRNLSVIYDPEGAVWPAAGCVGLCVFVDGAIAARADALARVTVDLSKHRYGVETGGAVPGAPKETPE